MYSCRLSDLLANTTPAPSSPPSQAYLLAVRLSVPSPFFFKVNFTAHEILLDNVLSSRQEGDGFEDDADDDMVLNIIIHNMIRFSRFDGREY